MSTQEMTKEMMKARIDAMLATIEKFYKEDKTEVAQDLEVEVEYMVDIYEEME